MQLYRLGTLSDAKAFLKELGVESGGVGIMAKKMSLYYIYIKDLPTPAANILKQDALSIGAELAVPGGVITCEKPAYDCLLIGTQKHIETLSRKELAQPFGLKALAKRLKSFIKTPRTKLRIMGVLNANEDSFYAESRFDAKEAQSRIETMIEEGADIIDIGAVSSRPGAKAVDVQTELARLKPVCDVIKTNRLYEKALFSIDSYTPEAVRYALDSGFGMVNDITGAGDDKVVNLVAKYGAEYCVMHMRGTPETMQKNPTYEDVMVELDRFFSERIKKCEANGIPKEKLLLDVGIGFGKRLEHNLTLLKNLSHFLRFGCELLVGASRKSMIDAIVPTSVEARLPGTLALHLKAYAQGARVIRCHDVAEHVQALRIAQALDA